MSNDNNTAMRDADGKPVFVRESGEYAEAFPRENIVRRADGADETMFRVYAFVGSHGDYEEASTDLPDEDSAVEKATELYGAESDLHDRDGEVFEVEVHEIPADDADLLGWFYVAETWDLHIGGDLQSVRVDYIRVGEAAVGEGYIVSHYAPDGSEITRLNLDADDIRPVVADLEETDRPTHI